ncbi:MAG: branched-chain amino acid ABC transporter substrate-binding protein [Candidatus Dormibacteraceae bacterium]
MRSLLRASTVACSALLLALPACSGDGAAATADKTISIGVDLPLTGVEGRAGTATLNGVRFFVQRHPVLDGFTISVDARDDPAGASRATARGLMNLEALIAQPRVLAIIGPFDSNVARAQIPVANRAHLALVSPGTSSRCLTKEPFLPALLNPARTAITCHAAGLPSPSDLRPTGVNNFFRLSTTDDLQGPAAADYASRQLHLRRVAVLTDGEAYGQGLADSFIARFTHLGGTAVAHMDLDPSKAIDAAAFLQAAKNDHAQGVYYGGTSANHACVLSSQMARVFGTDTATPLLGGDGIALDPACVGDAGATAINIYATVPAADPEHVDSASPVIAAFRSAYGRPEDFGPGTVAAYDATGVVYNALDRAIKASAGNLPARDSVVAELAATRAYSGATGVFGFDPEGDTTLRLLSIFRPAAADLDAGWTWLATADYSAALPY